MSCSEGGDVYGFEGDMRHQRRSHRLWQSVLVTVAGMDDEKRTQLVL